METNINRSWLDRFSENTLRRMELYNNRNKKYYNKIVKGGKNQMETKSRYEIISDLEEKKHRLMNDLSRLDLKESRMKQELDELKKDLDEFQKIKKIEKENLQDQIKSIEKSLERFNTQKK